MSDLTTLRTAVESHFASRAADFGLDAGRVRAELVLNWGGFVNASFRVADGRTAYHLKLTDTADGKKELRRWYELRDVLAARYHAPPVVAWTAIPDTSFEGLLFPRLEGGAPDRLPPAVAAELLDVLGELHADLPLASRLAAEDGVRSRERVFLDTYHRRSVEDLDKVDEEPPPFVDRAARAWMHGEVERLREMVGRSPAFAPPADAPTHGDLWTANLLVAEDGSWFVLDWDDLRLGDPAQDLAAVLVMRANERWPVLVGELPPRVAADAALRERVELYARVMLLDWTVDAVADWIEARAAPEHAGEVRRVKEADHRACLARYRERYG